jgi:small subunit ribosomal protein S16
MAVKIRLTRMGAKKKPMYRIVAADSQAPRDGAFLEILGSYNPHQDPSSVQLKTESLEKWLAAGARPTDTVYSLLKSKGLWPQAQTQAAS